MIIGVDPHRLSHTASAVEALTNRPVASVRIDATIGGYREGTALPLLNAVCSDADDKRHTLVLHTRRPRLITL